MALAPPLTDYSDKDFDSILARLEALVASVFPEWTDQNRADFGNILLNLFAHVGDILTYYQDNQALESRIVTATQRRSLLGLVKLVGFKPATASPATVDVTLRIGAPALGAVAFPLGTVVSTSEVVAPTRFQTTALATIPAGALTATVTAENSAPAEDVFTSSGAPNQTFVLTATPYLDGTAAVSAADGAYSEVANFLDSGPTDRHFTVAVDQNDRARVRFGNGVLGAVPVGTVTIDYKTGGGAAGNVPAGAIRKVEGSFTDAYGTPVTVTVTNALKASGGNERMSNAQIKVLAPEQVRAPVNSIGREDFEINARRLPQVARALFLTAEDDVSIAENTGILYVIPQGGGYPSADLKALVLHQVTKVYPKPVTFRPYVYDPVYAQVDVYAQVYLAAGAVPATVRANVVAALTAFFAVSNADGTPNPNVDFGANMLAADGTPDPGIAWSDVFDAIRDATGVRKVDAGSAGLLLNGARADVVISPKEFPALGTVVLVDANTGQAL